MVSTSLKLVRETLRRGFSVELDSVGVSMFPLIISRHRIRFAPLGEMPLRRGDVVVFYMSGKQSFIAHRIVKIDGETITTRGDANLNVDEPLTLEQILGRVESNRWFFGIRINHNSTAVKLYGRMVMALCPVSNALNWFAARVAQRIYRIFFKKE